MSTGSFIWYELMTPDPDAAAKFYGAVIGWKFSPPPATPGGKDYRAILRSDGGSAGGVLKLTDDMQKHAVAELAFTVPLAKASSFASSTLRGEFSETTRAVYLAQLTDDRVWRIAQHGPDAEKAVDAIGKLVAEGFGEP